MRAWPLLAVAVGVGAGLAYIRLFRPWQMSWGATEEEVDRPMPLDERVANPLSVSTRAITIRARPEEIWPWLVQMGDGDRAGFYSYTWVERLLGMKVENSQRILSSFQELKAGDALDRAGTMLVKAVEPGEWLVLGPPEEDEIWVDVTWAFAIYPVDSNTSRLVTRVRAHVKRWSPAAVAWMAVMDPGVFVMERKMLLGIKERAERPAVERGSSESAAATAPRS